MSELPPDKLSRRERQIMEVIYRSGSATAKEVLAALPDPPSYSAVRATMRILEEKGHVKHEKKGPRYVFEPTTPAGEARRSALRGLLDTFFGGSTEDAFAALLDLREGAVDSQEADRLKSMIRRAQEEGR